MKFSQFSRLDQQLLDITNDVNRQSVQIDDPMAWGVVAHSIEAARMAVLAVGIEDGPSPDKDAAISAALHNLKVATADLEAMATK